MPVATGWVCAAVSSRVGFPNLLDGAEPTGKGRNFPAALFRYPDPSTEFTITRLTDPAHSSMLPASYGRAVSKHNFLIYASDMTGRFEAFRMDLKNGQSRQLTEAENLDPASLALTPDDRGFCYLDGDRVMEASLSNLRTREVYRLPAGFEGSGLSVAEDGLVSAITERSGVGEKNAASEKSPAPENSGSSEKSAAPAPEKVPEAKPAEYRLEVVNMLKGDATKLAESADEIHDPIPRPRRASILYRRAGAVWLGNYDGQQDYKLRLADGETGPARWSPDGRTVLYLNYPADRTKLHNLREFTPDTNEDKMLATTTQFVAFSPNADASVFVGASGSKASPHVLLLVRAVKRELTLAEHRASDPRMVSPVFSPNSQRVFFMSDQHGKPAIYTMAVDKLVEETSA
jgi:oligogalacturonide lyase